MRIFPFSPRVSINVPVLTWVVSIVAKLVLRSILGYLHSDQTRLQEDAAQSEITFKERERELLGLLCYAWLHFTHIAPVICWTLTSLASSAVAYLRGC